MRLFLLSASFFFSLTSFLSAGFDWSEFDKRGHFYVSVCGEAGVNGDGNLRNAAGEQASIRYSRPVAAGGVGVGYTYKMFRVEHVVMGYPWIQDSSVTVNGTLFDRSGFDMEVFSSVTEFVLDIPISSKWIPFIGVGMGVCSVTLNSAAPGGNSNSALAVEGVHHIELCGEMIAGVTYEHTEHWSFFGNYAFFFSDRTHSRDHSVSVKGLRLHSLRFGLRYVF